MKRFSRKCVLEVFEEQGRAQWQLLLMNFLQSDIREEMKIINELSVRIPRRLEWRCQNREKSNILGHFLGILGIFRGGKRTPNGKFGKFYLLDISCTQQYMKFSKY
jgi:hypothetical protein